MRFYQGAFRIAQYIFRLSKMLGLQGSKPMSASIIPDAHYIVTIISIELTRNHPTKSGKSSQHFTLWEFFRRGHWMTLIGHRNGRKSLKMQIKNIIWITNKMLSQLKIPSNDEEGWDMNGMKGKVWLFQIRSSLIYLPSPGKPLIQ